MLYKPASGEGQLPLIVDHAERRKKVIDAASEILVRSGLEAVTVRDVARAAGYSTSIVSHYFSSKRELLYLTFAANIERADAAGDAALEAGGDLKTYLSAVMPLDEPRYNGWRIWMAYIALVVAEPEIAKLQHDSANYQIARITGILDDLAQRGDIVRGLDHGVVARRLLAMVMGLALEVLFDRDRWPPERQHQLVDSELRPLYAPGRLPPTISPNDAMRTLTPA
jgi:AcrR family transcriptional regulator